MPGSPQAATITGKFRLANVNSATLNQTFVRVAIAGKMPGAALSGVSITVQDVAATHVRFPTLNLCCCHRPRPESPRI